MPGDNRTGIWRRRDAPADASVTEMSICQGRRLSRLTMADGNDRPGSREATAPDRSRRWAGAIAAPFGRSLIAEPGCRSDFSGPTPYCRRNP